MLTASSKSRQELTKRLAEKGYGEGVIREALDQLEAQGILSDRKYAEELLSRLTVGKPSGRRKIGFELKRHGIPRKIQEDILSSLEPSEERERARELALHKWDSSKNLGKEKQKKRVYDFLVRRGFDFEIARDIVQRLESSPS